MKYNLAPKWWSVVIWICIGIICLPHKPNAWVALLSALGY